jgi:ATP-binding cassette subfamily B (MDR/TAP) protein 1
MPDVGKAKIAAKGIFNMLDAQCLVEVSNNKNIQPIGSSVKGDIEFRNVSFKYPTRNDQIFKNLSFKISASSKIALVGPSGCGKSTIVSLLLRFYDVDEGEILFDGVNIKNYPLDFLRK